MLEGALCVEDDHREYTLTANDGEFLIRPWVNHRLYPSAAHDGAIKFLLAGEDTPELFKLDTIFFENWYGYQDETVVAGKGVDLIQVLSVGWASLMARGDLLDSNGLANRSRCSTPVAPTCLSRGGCRSGGLCPWRWAWWLGAGSGGCWAINPITGSGRLIGIWRVGRWSSRCSSGGLLARRRTEGLGLCVLACICIRDLHSAIPILTRSNSSHLPVVLCVGVG